MTRAHNTHTRARGQVGHTIALLLLLAGLGSAARADEPGRLFVGSFTRPGTITRIDLDTLATTVIVTGGIEFPEDGVCGPDGRIFFAESAFGRLTRFEQDGSGATPMNNGGECSEGLSFDGSGNLYFNTRGSTGLCQHTGVWQIPGADPTAAPVNVVPPFSEFGEGSVVVVDGDDEGDSDSNGDSDSDSDDGGLAEGDILAVARTEGKVVRAPAGGGIASDFIVGLDTPVGLAIDGDRRVYVSDVGTGEILRFADDGSFLGTLLSGIGFPVFLEVDSAGNLYIADFAADQVLRLRPDGTLDVIASIPNATGLALCEGNDGSDSDSD